MTTQQILPHCRICLESEREFIQPCKCTSVVHRDCLDKWRKTVPVIRHNNQRDTRCEICHTNYEFEGELTDLKYNKCQIAWDMFKILVFIQAIGFLLGMFIGWLGEPITIEVCEHMNLYLYQFLVGNAFIHVVIGILVAIGEPSDNGRRCCGVCLCDSNSLDSGGYDCGCILLIFVIFFMGLVMLVFGVYSIALENSKKQQKLANDQRRIKDLGGHSMTYVV